MIRKGKRVNAGTSEESKHVYSLYNSQHNLCFLSKLVLPLKNIRECNKTYLTDISCKFSKVKIIHVKNFLKERKRKHTSDSQLFFHKTYDYS